MSKKPTPTTRLAVWKEAASQGGPSRRLIDWSDEAAWAKIARAALDLDSGFDEKWNGPVRKAFKDFRLNPKDPYDWRLLLTLYAAAHASRGRPVKWNSESLCDLLRKISAAREKRPNAKPSEIYRSLVRPKAAYSGKSVDYLKHGHRLALDLERNDILRNARDLVAAGYLDVLRVSYQEKGWTITAADEKRIKDADTVLDDALEFIGAPLGRWAKK